MHALKNGNIHGTPLAAHDRTSLQVQVRPSAR